MHPIVLLSIGIASVQNGPDAPAKTSQSPPLTFTSVLQLSGTAVASVRIAQNEVKRARQRVSVAKAALGIRADAGVTNSYQEFVLPASQGGTQRGQNTTGDVSLTLPFDISGALASSIRSAYADFQSAEQSAVVAQNDVLLEAGTAMLRLARAQKQQQINDQIVTLVEAQLKDGQQQREAGTIAPVDVVRLESLRAQRLSEGRSLGAEINNAKFALARVLGTRATAIEEVELPTLQIDQNRSMEQLISLAGSKRPELRALDFQLASLKHQQSATKAQLLPSLNLSLQYQRLFGEAVGFTANEQRAATLSLRVPLTDGGAIRAQAKQFDQDIANVNLRKKQQLVEIESAIRSALNDLEAAQDRQAFSQTQAQASAEVLRVQRVRRQEGVATILEIVDSESQYRQSLINVTLADFDVLQARMNLLYAIGELSNGVNS